VTSDRAKVAWLDCSSGVSGDMLLGALAALDAVQLQDLARSLHLDVEIDISPTTRSGLEAVDVAAQDFRGFIVGDQGDLVPRLGVGQLVVTSRLAGPADRVRFGAHGQVIRAGLRVPVLRQGWAPLAVRHVLGAGRVDLVHVHCGEDVAVLPLARLAALRHGCPVVATVHSSELLLRHA